MASPSETVISGVLFKKATGGLKGFKRWNKRFFVITTKTVFIHKAEGEALESQVHLLEIRNIKALPNKRLGDRFDMVLKNGTVFALHSASQAESVVWIRAIERAMAFAKQQEREKEKPTNILDHAGQTKKYSGLQRLFFDAWFGESKMRVSTTKDTFRETQAILGEIEKDFTTESDVLRFLLLRFMTPSLNLITYDLPEVKDAEVRFSLSSSVQEVITYVGSLLGLKLDDVIKTFEDHMLFDIRDVIDSYVPSTIPHKVAMKIKEVLEEIREQAKSSHNNEMKAGAVAPTSPQDRIIAMVKSPQMMRNLVIVFSTTDTQAHGLAVRLLWAIYHATLPFARAVAEFTAQVCVQCGGSHLSAATTTALLSIVLEGNGAISCPSEEMEHLQFNRAITCVAAIKPFLGVLKAGNLDLWKAPLSDVTAMLHENIKNTTLVVEGNNWQVWFLNLLTELRKEDKNSEPCKSNFALIVNNFTLIHFNYFNRSPRFAAVIYASLFRVHHFAGSNRDCQNFVSVLLGTLVFKLTSQLRLFSSDYSSVEWINLGVLLTVLRKYVFQTAFLQTTPYLGSITADKRDGQSDDEGEAVVDTDPELYILARRTLAKGERSWNSENPDIKDYGVHWAPVADGPCLDVDLPKKLCTLLQKIGVSKITDDILYGKQKHDRETLLKLQGEFEFWEDASVFLKRLKREDISRRHLFSYRRLSHMCQAFCQEGKAGRDSALKQLTQLQASAEDDPQITPLPREVEQSRASTEPRQSNQEHRTLPRDQSSSRISSDFPEISGSDPPKSGSPLSSPGMRRLQSGNTASPTKHVGLAKQGSFRSSGGNSSSSFIGSWNESNSSSCSGSSSSVSSGSGSGLKTAPNRAAPKAPAKKPDELSQRSADKNEPPNQSSGATATLLAALSADIDDD